MSARKQALTLGRGRSRISRVSRRVGLKGIRPPSLAKEGREYLGPGADR